MSKATAIASLKCLWENNQESVKKGWSPVESFQARSPIESGQARLPVQSVGARSPIESIKKKRWPTESVETITNWIN